MNWEAVFSTRPVRQLRDATIELLLGDVFYVRSLPVCHKKGRSRVQLVVRPSSASNGVNMEAEEATALKPLPGNY
jgi:hypothetical protein